MRFLGWLLKPINPRFMSHYVTTIGSTIYAPGGEVYNEGLLNHELQHIADSKKYPVIYELSYLLLLPCGLTMRSFWERRAYRHSIKDAVSKRVSDEAIVAWILPQFTTSQYLWMDVRKGYVERWIRAEIERCRLTT